MLGLQKTKGVGLVSVILDFAELQSVGYMGDSQEALNRAYEHAEEQFGGYCSNWQWFQDYQDVNDPLDEVRLRIDQN